MKWKKKGSLTVEASFIISLSLITVGFMLSLCFYIYQRCWYTQAACESVLTGSAQGIWKGESMAEQAEKKWKSRKEEFYLKPESLTADCSGNKEQISLRISGKTTVWESMAEQAEKKWKSRKEEFYLKPESLTADCSGNKEQISLRISGKTTVWGKPALEFQTFASQKGIRPVRYIRKIQALMSGGS